MLIVCCGLKLGNTLNLQEAYWSHFNTKFLIWSSDVQWCNIYNRQSHSLTCSVLENCFTPVSCVFSATVFQNSVCKFAVSFGLQLTFSGAHEFYSLLNISILCIHVCNTVLAMVSDILRTSTRENSEESHLHIRNIFWELWITIAELESTAHRLAKPNMFLSPLRAGKPVLLWDISGISIKAGFTSFHIAENFNGIHLTTLVGVNPIFSTLQLWMAKL